MEFDTGPSHTAFEGSKGEWALSSAIIELLTKQTLAEDHLFVLPSLLGVLIPTDAELVILLFKCIIVESEARGGA